MRSRIDDHLDGAANEGLALNEPELGGATVHDLEDVNPVFLKQLDMTIGSSGVEIGEFSEWL
ncbi:hypothetical protein [Tropicibacter sp. Alg240-R139]|uniref:hypothetical protein n=1 Tax=Tropicibacter sp. Alg240-R139 TaxID=2305991 RepID=UPI0013E0DB8E|nr:hypothetical protein [Tropicibacter sp. Alg240-R139]